MLREAKSSLILRHYLRANPLEYSCTFEMKDTRGKNALAFDAVDQAQLDYALAIEGPKGVLLRNQGGSGEPDYTYHIEQRAYIAIKYPKTIYCIRVVEFIREKYNSARKSLTAERAEQIAELVIKQ